MRGEETTRAVERGVRIGVGSVELEGDLAIPADPAGVVLFAHGSGSSRFSRRNRFVAGELQKSGFATLLMDLLTREEEAVDARTGHLRFDIGLLAERLVAAIDWLREHPDTHRLGTGCFGASTGGGAALVAAAERPGEVAAVVSRGGRPDLAGPALPRVRAPTLLIVGGDDGPVIGMNEEAMALMRCEVRLEIVPGATHLFEEPGRLPRPPAPSPASPRERPPRSRSALRPRYGSTRFAGKTPLGWWKTASVTRPWASTVKRMRTPVAPLTENSLSRPGSSSRSWFPWAMRSRLPSSVATSVCAPRR
jgi:dienelactone hydrolase